MNKFTSLFIILESELVSGFMTEHSAVIFVFFFLAEYASIVLICILTAILFFGGYLLFYPLDVFVLLKILFFFNIISPYYFYSFNPISLYFNDMFIEGILYSLMLGLKSCLMIFIFILARASFPRIRFDQLMSFCWTVLLPIIIAFIILMPCFIYSLNILPTNFYCTFFCFHLSSLNLKPSSKL